MPIISRDPGIVGFENLREEDYQIQEIKQPGILTIQMKSPGKLPINLDRETAKLLVRELNYFIANGRLRSEYHYVERCTLGINKEKRETYRPWGCVNVQA